jgi:hypothetical protein
MERFPRARNSGLSRVSSDHVRNIRGRVRRIQKSLDQSSSLIGTLKGIYNIIVY